MSIAMGNPTGAVRAASSPLDAMQAGVQDGEGEAISSFADALDGLAAALIGFDVAGELPVTGESQASETPDGESAADTSAPPALVSPQVMLSNLPAMAAALPAAMVLPTLAATALPEGESSEPTAAAPAAVKAGPAGPAASLRRQAETAVSTPLPAAVPQAEPAVALASNAGLPAKPKAEAGAAEAQADAAPIAPVADVTPTLATALVREAAGGTGMASAVKLPATQPEQWRQPLMEALGERIRVAVGKHSEEAVIRLDPPMLGSVEIILRHQGGVLQVQLSASHDEVVRQLQQIGDSLRQDLARNQYTDVSVQVFAGSRDGDGRQHADGRPDERQPGRALADAEDDGEKPSAFVLSSNEH